MATYTYGVLKGKTDTQAAKKVKFLRLLELSAVILLVYGRRGDPSCGCLRVMKIAAGQGQAGRQVQS